MSILSFDKPKKIASTKEHNSVFCSDSGIAGTYVPNMSEEDMNKWKAKHIKGKDERIEIRKAFGGALAVIVVHKYREDSDWYNNVSGHENVVISANGKMQLSFKDWEDMMSAIKEARQILLC